MITLSKLPDRLEEEFPESIKEIRAFYFGITSHKPLKTSDTFGDEK